ncbi:DUF4238 domain-containing protein [Ralstonia solanacearum]|uniref:DUF4238 domain-containing protein n=1 Tax=Ralstonia solanacearum TaxID=305 RepID=UPI0005C5ED52|nr:DUF4238 domain-containing protein [Ralstonia solanacearum]MDB0544139.1 DUF4238 domain-containing protein [Ralstonia solanacearum]MDB0553901.1 DUF4238 domain-containing protein [Ralstonia solanacearum]MDB0559062.1 DUF4238 domain-containing protein [Ralstonia solanacearum]
MTTAPRADTAAGAHRQGCGAGARNHHYVPQCYLKGFASSRGKNAQLHVVDAVRRRAFTTTPRNVAAQRDFNRIEVPGFDPNVVEGAYATLEARLAPALKRLEAIAAPTTEADLAVLLELVGLLAVRNPGQRETARRFFAEVASRIMGLALADKERWEGQVRQAQAAGRMRVSDVTYEQMREFVASGQYAIEVPTTRHVHHELQLLQTVVPLLRERNWLLLRAAPDSGGFVTSDRPVTLCWSDSALDGGLYGPGFASRGTTVVCPLSHQLALLGAFGEPAGVIELSDDVVAAVNTRTIAEAGSQIYAQSDRFHFIGQDGVAQRGNALLDMLRQRDP